MALKPVGLLGLLDALASTLEAKIHPPGWLTDEATRRLLILFNHILLQEPLAGERLSRQSGRSIQLQWREQKLRVRISAAGLFEVCDEASEPDLTVQVTQAQPSELAAALMAGSKPQVRIEGDVQLAADLNWIVDHVRWDVEHDLSRLIGDAPAHTLVAVGKQVLPALRQFAAMASRRFVSPMRGG